MNSQYRYPFTPYPRGWYRICSSQKLGKGFHFFGGKVEVQREDSGKARVILDRCPLPTKEQDGSIFASYGEGENVATFDLPRIEEFDDKNWCKPFHLKWCIRVHVQEIAENAIDVAHFDVVHRYSHAPLISNLRFEKHQFGISLASSHGICGILFKTDTDICYHGLGIVDAKIGSPAVTLRVLLTTTPIDEENSMVVISTAIKKQNPFIDALMLRVMPWEVHREFSRDLPVWENKAYHARPGLCAEDGGIMKVRRWARQFYEAGNLLVATEF